MQKVFILLFFAILYLSSLPHFSNSATRDKSAMPDSQIVIQPDNDIPKYIPDKDIDYKITEFVPDSTIDYKILESNPYKLYMPENSGKLLKYFNRKHRPEEKLKK